MRVKRSAVVPSVIGSGVVIDQNDALCSAPCSMAIQAAGENFRAVLESTARVRATEEPTPETT